MQAGTVTMDKALTRELIETVARRVIDHADELTALDQAIGDGDHGLNMKRGFEAVLVDLDTHSAKPLPEALKAVGMALVMKVGGASGPLYGTLFMSLGKALPAEPGHADLVLAFSTAIDAVKARGKSEVGQKTMLDVLAPAQIALAEGRDPAAAAAAGGEGDDPDEGAEGPRLVPRRPVDRPHGPGRAIQRIDHRGNHAKLWDGKHEERQCRHRRRLALRRHRAGHRRHGAPDGGRRDPARLLRRQSRRRPRHQCRDRS